MNSRPLLHWICLTTLFCASPALAEAIKKAPPNDIGFHHPTEIEIKKQIDLPLQYGKFMTCTTCHNEHNTTAVKNKIGLSGEVLAGGKIPNFLRKPYRELCKTCHDEKLDTHHNHMNLNAHLDSKKADKVENVAVITCSQCHKMHSSRKKLMRTAGQDVCASCHKNKKFNHPSLMALSNTGLTSRVSLDENKMICTTCHDPHDGTVNTYFIRKDRSIYQFCANCHGQNAIALYDGFHKPKQPQGSK